MRPHLQAYYENQKAEAVAAWRTREPIADDVVFRFPDGNAFAGKPIQITAEQMEKAIVPFDKWLDFQIDRFINPGFGHERLKMAQKQLDLVQANGPNTTSDVRTTFSSNGVLLATINTDGTSRLSNGSAQYLNVIVDKADELNLSGQRRVDYLTREMESALWEHHGDLDVTNYSDNTIPTKREYARLWQRNFDIDAHYVSSLAAAQASYDDAHAWHQQSQEYLNHMRDFLLKTQEA